MKTILVSIAICCIYGLDIQAQAPDTVWTRTYGNIFRDEGYAIMQTADNDYYIAGYFLPLDQDSTDIRLMKVDSEGELIWSKFYGGTGSDYCFAAELNSDGTIILAGYTFSFETVAGDIYIIKTSPEGDTIWTRTYGGGNWDVARAICPAYGGGYMVLGYSFSNGMANGNAYLIRIDENGDSLWTRNYGGPGMDGGFSIKQTGDSCYIAAGFVESASDNTFDCFVFKIDSLGNSIWERTYGGPADDVAYSVEEAADGGYIMVGYTESFGSGQYDVYIVRTESNGDSLWARTYGGEQTDDGSVIRRISNDEYIIAGRTSSYGAGQLDIYLLKIDDYGDTVWTTTCGGVSYDRAFALQQTSDNGFIVCGYTWSFGMGFADIYVVKFGSEQTPIEDLVDSFPSVIEISGNYPNPFNARTTIRYSIPEQSNISIDIFDILGRHLESIDEGMQAAGKHLSFWDAGNYTSGTYLYRIQVGEHYESRKMILIK